MPSQDLILETKGLTKYFEALKAVDNINLRVRGGVHSIIGPNGAGKTTLFNLLTGFLMPTSGEIRYLGKEITRLPPYEISQLGMARSFQITSIFPDLTVYENVRIAVQSRLKACYNFFISFKKLRGVDAKTREVLGRVGLLDYAHSKARHLSYGLQRGLDIGISLATDPKLILLDEPTSGMDQKDSNQVIRMISEVSTKIPVVLIEHNIDIVLSISDVVTVLYQGGVLAHGTPSEIQKNDKVQEAYLGGY
ncbi:MAG: ABC transporter ATP-binding protein [Proteobacteria bacterium]|nr:ABC transporter ATP-binding protein [Desulfobacterales bacterium]MBU0734964.1 ABC transporter ATP-binding protein [Pseudomonadota bacterium]MBU1902410.1 ABC transporter ATP-binding protein [Pseudomonadota bacterium]